MDLDADELAFVIREFRALGGLTGLHNRSRLSQLTDWVLTFGTLHSQNRLVKELGSVVAVAVLDVLVWVGIEPWEAEQTVFNNAIREEILEELYKLWRGASGTSLQQMIDLEATRLDVIVRLRCMGNVARSRYGSDGAWVEARAGLCKQLNIPGIEAVLKEHDASCDALTVVGRS